MERQETLTPKIHAAYHEAGHAVAYTVAWCLVQLPPDAPPVPPEPPIAYVEIIKAKTGHWAGFCKNGRTIYSTEWDESRVAEKWRDGMMWELIYSLAGGLAEAIHRGPKQAYRGTLAFAATYCGMAGKGNDERGHASDIDQFIAVRDDLWRLERGSLAKPAQRAFTLLRKHWPAVEAIAAELMQVERIDGARVEQIFDQAVRWRGAKRAPPKQAQ